MGNLIGVQSEVEDLMDSRKKILNNIGIKVGEAVTSRARDGKISDHLIDDIDILITGLSSDEQVKVLERALLTVARNCDFRGSSGSGSSKSQKKNNSFLGGNSKYIN